MGAAKHVEETVGMGAGAVVEGEGKAFVYFAVRFRRGFV